MLQWFDSKRGLIAYNDTIQGKCFGLVSDLNGRKIRELPHAIVHLTGDGKLACSYNFLRVEAAMPGYGTVIDSPNLGTDQDNWFHIFNCETGQTQFKISLSEAAAFSPHISMDGAFHFFHHALFNPSNQRVFFLHRWIDRNQRRWTRMFSIGVNGEELYLFPMNEMVSHITWASDTEIFAYARYPGIGMATF
jgi:hypothetical protein